MQAANEIIKRIKELLSSGEASSVIGWKKGEFCYDESPAVFGSEKQLEEFVCDDFSAANVSKYLIDESQKEGKIAALLKPCDTYSFNQLLTEHRIKRENVIALGIPCSGKIDIDKISALGIKGITSVESDGESVVCHTIYGDKTVKKSEVLLEKCMCCKGSKHAVYDELVGCSEEDEKLNSDEKRFEKVSEIESMTPDERYEFWRSQLSKCIRCNACRNVCPACSCRTCIFDNPELEVSAKVNTTSFEENMFHIIRAFHVAGRCTDCGECSRVCPQHIPLHLLNRKFIKDINENYGEYQAGAAEGSRAPLVSYTTEDIEPNDITGGGKA